MEVKATTTGSARLTPYQAETASGTGDRYTLCVVDLRGVAPEDLDAQWTAERIEPLARLFPNIGHFVGATWNLVEEASSNDVPILNERALRYEVPPEVWTDGFSIDSWVAQVARSALT